jgi:choline-sulfatase
MRILYIDIDSQRPDHLGCYGYHRNTSPNIDAIAAEGVRCNGVYTSDAPCLPSRTAFYSGRFGIQTGVVGHGMTTAQPKVQGQSRGFRDWFDEFGLARQLQKAGYHTAMISPFGQRHAAWHFYAGFHEIHNTGLGGMESAEHVDPVMHKWFDDNAATDNWYLHINFWDPHTPYRVPDEYGEPFENDPIPQWLDDDQVIERHHKTTGPHTAQDKGMYSPGNPKACPRSVSEIKDRDSVRHWINGYDTAVRYVDDRIGWMVKQLKDAGVYEDTAIIISADHGENQGELGIYGEHGTADQATCRIPMIIKWPGGKQGHVDDGLHYNVDFAPTLMELLGTERNDLWDGESYASAILNGAEAGRDDLVVSQGCHVCQRSVRWDQGDKQWLYMRTYHDGFRLFPQEMLFDLAADPHEQNDLAEQQPEICREGAWRLSRWHDEQMWKMSQNASDVVDPLWTVVQEGGPFHAIHTPAERSPLPKYLKRLEETGRGDGAEALRKKYAKWLPDDA